MKKIRMMDTLSGEQLLSKLICLPFEKGSILKRKEFAPTGSKFFPFKVDPFQKGLVCGKFKGLLKKIGSLVKNGRKSTKNVSP